MLPEALPYHVKVRDHFRQHTSAWESFAAAQTREEQLAAVRSALLKDAVPLQRNSNAMLYASIDLAAERLGLGDVTVSVYQADLTGTVCPGREVDLVLGGSFWEKLNERELQAIVAHELARVRLHTLLNGELEVACRIISAIAGGQAGDNPVYVETARRFEKYTDIFCDRGALTVVGDSAVVITGLVKMATGLPEVTAAHAENFTRARAIQLWQEKGEQAEPVIQKMTEGQVSLSRLDVFSQAHLHAITRGILLELLRPDWTRTSLVLSLARRYFPDLSWNGIPEIGVAGKLGTILAEADKSVHDYFSYLLLDLALADPKLGNRLSSRVDAFAGDAGLSPWPFDKKNYLHKT